MELTFTQIDLDSKMTCNGRLGKISAYLNECRQVLKVVADYVHRLPEADVFVVLSMILAH